MKIVNKYLLNNHSPDTLKKKTKYLYNIKNIFSLPEDKNNIKDKIIKSLYYQGILTHYWLFMEKSITYNHKIYSSVTFSYRFAKYHFEKTHEKYLYFKIKNIEYRVKTYGYKLVFTEIDKMFSLELAYEKKIKDDPKFFYSPCMIIKEFRNLFKKYFGIIYKYNIYPDTLSYNRRCEYYYNQNESMFKNFIDEYKNKYSDILVNYIIENDKLIFCEN